MLHVSSVSKSTIDSPPLAISALFGGRKRATTIRLYELKVKGMAFYVSYTFDSVVATGAPDGPKSDL